ncbi:hypothetical protein [Paenibacillus sp. PAMC21692]|uniref:hypothetical protein n=1 Tax=Paenibacillus sp. PAMC21692 TaxID=2762320 RepID=UPI00164DCE45|nr:hypothetical protein [Paenibacillus sp. PAMC21692]QNK54556.1 hypothetical protein H7F31_18010 [Paenibacillus sp. PAMC21692]
MPKVQVFESDIAGYFFYKSHKSGKTTKSMLLSLDDLIERLHKKQVRSVIVQDDALAMAIGLSGINVNRNK